MQQIFFLEIFLGKNFIQLNHSGATATISDFLVKIPSLKGNEAIGKILPRSLIYQGLAPFTKFLQGSYRAGDGKIEFAALDGFHPCLFRADIF